MYKIISAAHPNNKVESNKTNPRRGPGRNPENKSKNESKKRIQKRSPSTESRKGIQKRKMEKQNGAAACNLNPN